MRDRFGSTISRRSGFAPNTTFRLRVRRTRPIDPGAERCWKTTHEGHASARRSADAIERRRRHARYVRFLDDFPVYRTHEHLGRTRQQRLRRRERCMSFRRTRRSSQRCLLMTTDPGDLVLRPDLRSGTTAYVAEQWGRRWITCDTSRVAVTLAKQRLMTARLRLLRARPPGRRRRQRVRLQDRPARHAQEHRQQPEISEA